MRFGIMLPTEMPAGSSQSEQLALVQEVAKRARVVGFRSVWALHHVVSNVPTFQPIPLLASLAPVLPGMGFGTGLYVLPLGHPVAVAGEVATLDVLTGGNTVFGVAVGYFEPEFAAMGIRLADRGRRLEEQVGILRRLWSGEPVSFHGSHFHLDDVQLQLVPLQPSGPPLWIGGVSDAAIARAARLADGWLLPPDLDPRALQRRIDVFRREMEPLEGSGERCPPVLAAQRECLVGENRAEAMAAARVYLRQNAAVYAERGMTWIADRFERWFEGSYLVGTWEDVAEKIETLARMGIAELHLRVAWGDCPPEVTLRTVELVGQHVIPLFADSER